MRLFADLQNGFPTIRANPTRKTQVDAVMAQEHGRGIEAATLLTMCFLPIPTKDFHATYKNTTAAQRAVSIEQCIT